MTELAAPPLVEISSLRRIWLSSDKHLFHENILNFIHPSGQGKLRPEFASVAEMNECILDNHNSLVRTGDKHYDLGDIFLGSNPDDFRRFWPKFNGRKTLILGNHDDARFLSTGGFFKNIHLFKKMSEIGIFLSHVPMHEQSILLGGYPMLNVHGHIHAHKAPDGPYVNISMEATGYKPVDMEELISIREAMNIPSATEIFKATRKSRIKSDPI